MSTWYVIERTWRSEKTSQRWMRSCIRKIPINADWQFSADLCFAGIEYRYSKKKNLLNQYWSSSDYLWFSKFHINFGRAVFFTQVIYNLSLIHLFVINIYIFYYKIIFIYYLLLIASYLTCFNQNWKYLPLTGIELGT